MVNARVAALVVASLVAGVPQSQALTLGSCGWFARADPTILNAASPDEDAVYYAASLPVLPPGFSYRIRGEFPHARYMSFVVYDGIPIDSVGDFEIAPDPGSTNPFLPGAKRTAAARSYTVPVTFDRDEDEAGVLYAGPGQANTPFDLTGSLTGIGILAPYMAYRIYVPDAATDPRGGIELPRIEIVFDGAPDVDASAIPCEGVRDAIPDLAAVHEAIAQAAFPLPAGPPLPAQGTNPPTWATSTGNNVYERLAPLGLGVGEGTTGGIGSNPHNTYVGTLLARAHGDVVAIRAKAPTAPKTRDGQKKMKKGDLRYWSFCTNSSRTTRFVDCISDSDIVVDPDGTFTIAISTPEHRPATAANWIVFGPEPDARVLYRHMLPSAAFYPHSAQYVEASGLPIEDVMGEYYPRAVYCTAAEFDADRCGL